MVIAIFLQPVGAAEPPMASIRFGLTAGTIYGVDMNDALAAQETWTRLVMQKVNPDGQEIEVKSVVYANVSEASEAIEQGQVDVVVLLSLEYLSLAKEIPIVPLLTTIVGDLGEQWITVTHKSNHVQNIEELQSLPLIISTKGNDKYPELWLETALLEKNLPATHTFFNSIKYVDKASQAVLSVFFKQSDVCLIPRADLEIAIKLNPQLGTDLQSGQHSPFYNRTMVCVEKSYYEKFGDRIRKAVEITKQTKKGQQLFAISRAGGIIPFEEAHLENTRRVLETYQTLSGNTILP